MTAFRFTAAPFKAFRQLRVSDKLGNVARINVPAAVSNAGAEFSARLTERFVIQHGGAFTEIAYQAYLDAADWFRFHRPKAVDSAIGDFLFTRMKRAFRNATRYQQRLADRNFAETYFGSVVADQLQSIKHLRSAAYDVTRGLLPDGDDLDAAFIVTIYVLACFQGSILDAVCRTEFQRVGINWKPLFATYRIDDVARFADRLLLRKYHFDILAHKERVERQADYVFRAMTRSAFDNDRLNRYIGEAMQEIPEAARAQFGSLREQLEMFGSFTFSCEAAAETPERRKEALP